ncbi:MAG: hydrogenase [Planctomycetes bacterium]|nr:hydrogenase [Planctomycetota bacterium]
MNSWVNCLVVLIAITNLRLLGSSRIVSCIHTVAFQGILLGVLAVVGTTESVSSHAVAVAAVSVMLKGFVFPWLLTRALRETQLRREVEPAIGFGASMLLGVLLIGVCLWIGSRLPLPQGVRASPMVVPAALFTILVGLFMIVARRKALTQVVGYLSIENGIAAFGLGFALKEALLVELGILLDAFVAVFVMGIIIFHISREFDHIDADELSALKD